MAKPESLSFDDFAARYCARHVQTPEGLRELLREQRQRYTPDGWVMLECQMLGGSRCGEYTVIAYGPQNTWKAPPTSPVSPRGLASDMSIVVATLAASEVQL